MNRFFKNQPNKICTHLCEKASKGRFLKPKKFQDLSNERKGNEKKRERGEVEKAMVALLVFLNGGNVLKDSARYIINIFDKEA